MKKTLVIMAVFALMASTASVANAQVGYGGRGSRSGDRNRPTLPSQASPVAFVAVGRVLGASTLGLGSRGPEVVALQDYLRTAGYFKVNSTGYFGPITQAALAAYEADNGPLDLGQVLGASIDPETQVRIVELRGQLAAAITQLIALLQAQLNSAQ